MREKRTIFFLAAIALAVSYATYVQKEVDYEKITVREIVRLPIGLRERELFLKVHPDKMVITPKLLPPDADGFWIIGEAKGGIMRVSRSGMVIALLRPHKGFYPWPKVNSLGYIAMHYLGDEIVIYNPRGLEVGMFKVKGCSECGHPYCQTMTSLDDKGQIWLRFLSSNRSVEEDPNQTVCVASFDSKGHIVQHVKGSWAVDIKGRLFRRTKSIGGSYIILKTETMETTEIPVPKEWNGLFIGMDSDKDLIWWRAWRLDNNKVSALMAFDKEGIVAMLPMPTKFLGAEPEKKIFLSEAVIGTDGRLYIAQCTRDAFYIFEADMSFLKR